MDKELECPDALIEMERDVKEHDEPEGVIKVMNTDGIKTFLVYANTLTKSVM